MKISRYLHAYRVRLKNNFVREIVYRTNFITSVTVDMIWMAIELTLFSVLYANVPDLAGWTKVQVFLFLGVFFASDAIFTVFLQTNFWNFSNLVNHRELDILLTKPVHPLFLTLTRSVSFTAMFNILLGFVIMIRYADAAGFAGGWHWLQVGAWLFLGPITAGLMRFMFCMSVFWTDRGGAFSRLYYQFFAFATKPDVLYPKSIRYVLLTFLPFAFIGSVPTRAVLYGLEPSEYFHIGLVLTAFFGINTLLWKAGLKRYQSASS